MNLSTAQHDRLAQLLQEELDSAALLLQILEREYQILNNGDAKEIETVTEKKLNGMSGLQRILAERDQVLSQYAIEGVEATEALISQLPPDSGIACNWQQLKDLAARLKQQNEINGTIITIGQRNTHNALDILSGRQLNETTTYNPDGERQRGSSSGTLIKV